MLSCNMFRPPSMSGASSNGARPSGDICISANRNGSALVSRSATTSRHTTPRTIVNDHAHQMTPNTGVDPSATAVRRASWCAQLAARLFASYLDRQLAAGFVGPIGSALAVRAARLESESERHSVARVLRRAVVESHRGRPLGAPTVPVNRDNVAAAEDTIDRITLRLHSPRRVSARGMARLQRVVSDGCGPLYARGDGNLDDRLRAALAAL